MNAEVEVWLIEPEKKILVTDYPGPPGAITGFVSEEARQAAQARGYPTVSEIGFPSSAYLGKFDDWQKALEVANTKAAETGFKVAQEDRFMDSPTELGRFLAEFDEGDDEDDPDYDDMIDPEDW